MRHSMTDPGRVPDDSTRLEEGKDRIISKRRSSIFNTRTVIFQNSEEIGDSPAGSTDCTREELRVDKQVTCNIGKVRTDVPTSVYNQEAFDLQQYVDHLVLETKVWRKLYSDRKAAKRYVTKEKRVVECKGQEATLSALSDIEQNFIMSRPKYKDIKLNYKKLSDSSVGVSTLSQLILQLHENYVRRMEENLHNVVKCVVRLSECVQ